MKKLIILSIYLAFSLHVSAQDRPCMQGDCKNEYGSYYNEQTSVVYHGFFKDGIYNGVGYHQNAKGSYYLSQFKNMMPTGFTVYDEGGGRTSGLYINGLKSGPHVRIVKNGRVFTREVLNYEKGFLLNRKTYSTPETPNSPCLAGTCENGFGILHNQGMLLIGIFNNKRLAYGEFLQLSNGNSEFFIVPSQDKISSPYFKVSLIQQQGGSVQEVAATYKGRDVDGQYIVVNASTGQTGGALFKDNELVKKY